MKEYLLGTINLVLPKADLPLNMKCAWLSTVLQLQRTLILLILLLVLTNVASFHENIVKDLSQKPLFLPGSVAAGELIGHAGSCGSVRDVPASPHKGQQCPAPQGGHQLPIVPSVTASGTAAAGPGAAKAGRALARHCDCRDLG